MKQSQLQENVMPSSLETILASDRFPSLPEVAMRVVQIARQQDPDFSELIDAIRMDPAIAGRIVKTANSALLGMRTRASSIESAVPRLGTTMVRALVLGFSLADSQRSTSLNLRPWYQQIWRESLIQAAAAEMLADRQSSHVDPGNWFLAGLLQDIGRLALLSTAPAEYLLHVLDVNDSRSQLERELDWFGFTHTHVSAALCRRWNLDDEIVSAVGMHHAAAHRLVPLRFVSSKSLVAGLITAAHFAEYLEAVSHNPGCSREKIERLLMQVFALRPSDILRLLADVDTRVGEIAAAFNLDIGPAPPQAEILAAAQEILAQIAVSSQLRLVNATAATEDVQSLIGVHKSEASETAPPSCWHDAGTQTFNRAYLNHALTAVLQQSHDENVPLGLMLVTIHSPVSGSMTLEERLGEVYLRKVAQVLKHSVRLSDVVVRYSANQFLIVMNDINVDLLPLLAEQLQRQVVREVQSDISVGDAVRFRVGTVFCDPSCTGLVTAESLLQKTVAAITSSKDVHADGISEFSLINGRLTAPEISIPFVPAAVCAAATNP